MDNDELKHVGVLGMKWGVRRGSGSVSSATIRRNREDSVKEARRRTGLSSTSHKNIKKMSDKELDKELETLSTHHALMGGKKIDRATRKANSPKARLKPSMGKTERARIKRILDREGGTKKLLVKDAGKSALTSGLLSYGLTRLVGGSHQNAMGAAAFGGSLAAIGSIALNGFTLKQYKDSGGT